MRPLFNKYFATEGGGSDTSDSEDKGLETLELLNEEDPVETLELDKPKKEAEGDEGDTEEDKEDGEDEEVDELKEIEEELEGPKEEDLELMTPVRRKEILAKYPKLFKDFPYLEKAYYREQQFTEVFPTINDARQSADKARFMDSIDQSLMNGDISTVLAATKQGDQEAFYKIADNYLPALRKVDSQAYYHVLGNVIKDTIVTMVKEGRALGEQGAPLQAAANILNQFVFGSQNFQPPTTLSRRSDPREQSREQEIQYREQQQVIGRFETVKDELQGKADNVLKSTIDQNIDPKGSMTDYVKKNATKDAYETLETLISRDSRFRGLLDRLWEKAFERGFDKDSTDRIKSAYLSKAKTLLPSVIKKARNDALKGLGRRASDDDDSEIETKTSKKGPITPGRSTAPSSGKIRNAKDIPRNTSTLEFLMKD